MILKYLIENKQKKFSIREIAIALDIDYKPVYLNIKKLFNEGSASIEVRGNTKLCSFSEVFNGEVFNVESKRKKELLENKDFLIMYNRLRKINKQFILLMFGSQVNKTASKHSDIDVLAIASNEEIKHIENEINLFPYNIHLTAITYDEFIQMLKSKEFSVVSEAIKKNVLLFGTEDYYRIIENAR